MIKGVFFDLYGTLYEYGDMRAEANVRMTRFHACLTEYGLKMTKAAFVEYCREQAASLEAAKPVSGLTPFEQRTLAVCTGLGVSLPEGGLQCLIQEILNVWEQYVTVDPDALPVAEKLASSGKIVGLISNFDHPPYIPSLLERSRLGGRFDPVVLSGDIGVRKPDTKIFQAALAKAGLRPEDTIYVGDSSEDMTGANAAGMYSVLIERHGQPKDYAQKRVIRSLSEILDLV